MLMLILMCTSVLWLCAYNKHISYSKTYFTLKSSQEYCEEVIITIKDAFDDAKILSLVTKNPFTTWKKCQEYSLSLSMSTIKRCLYDCKYRGFTTKYKRVVMFKNMKAGLDFARTFLFKRKKHSKFWKQICRTDDAKINLRMMGR